MAEAAFGVQLRRSRQAAALSLRQLATRVGYDHSYLSQVERGRRPGSADLAQLCDRELGTAGALTTAFHQSQQTHRPRPTPVTGPASPVPTTAPARGGADVLEAVRHGLTGSLGHTRATDEWTALVHGYATDLPRIPPGELLPELTADLDLLHRSVAPGSPDLAVPAAQYAVLIALTLTALGRSRAADRWWRTARATADGSTERSIASQARSWQVLSATAEPRVLTALLPVSAEASALAERPADHARATAAQARLLALLGLADEARQAVRDLPPAEKTCDTSLFGWAPHESPGVASFVHTTLGDTAAAYAALDCALALCPADRCREQAELQLQLAECLVLDGDAAIGLSMAMRVLVELEDQWHTPALYDAGGRVLSAVQGKELSRPAVRDYRDLLRRRPFNGRSVGSGSSIGSPQG
ncbi:transcriptional regulator, XRE family [Kribbella flavida DSM 17836]|uniref:Transcriptional regulator, XRE family n=1 Tax=Kribbella flavida (strain DSM 17836 / JCM 10339 / NBRC 14399) TaxID=479435 RepID=D2PL44_KRIFD|nr:helix-turn-helix transcriptional regulator [Kribbella flavida]ADB34299.1 transcriptional regulator, XRE family [Kribbella flavida DSM 17836]